MPRRAASVAMLCTLKDVTPEIARKIRHVWKEYKLKEARETVDKLFETHGVEFLGIDRRSGVDVYYCNAGDTYAPTILFKGTTLFVSTWGDLVERNSVRDPQSQY